MPFDIHQNSVSTWLENIGRERDFPLSLGDDGHCIIPCADNLNCIVEVVDHDDVTAVFIYLPLIVLPEDPLVQSMTLSKALTMNLFGITTGGCHIGLDTRSDFIVLSFSSAVESLDEILFKLVLGDMLKVAPSLRQRLTQIGSPGSHNNALTSAEFYSRQAHYKRLGILPGTIKEA